MAEAIKNKIIIVGLVITINTLPVPSKKISGSNKCGHDNPILRRLIMKVAAIKTPIEMMKIEIWPVRLPKSTANKTSANVIEETLLNM